MPRVTSFAAPVLRWSHLGSLLLAAALVAYLPLAARTTERPDSYLAALPVGATQLAPTEGVQIQREGTPVVELLGHFNVQGERVSFQSHDQSLSLVALENLALERISRQVAETPKLLTWAVTGSITEYRGQNFLLVSRAQLKPTTSRKLGGPSEATEP